MKKNVIFVWIPKTAGGSIWKGVLAKQNGSVGNKELWNDATLFNNEKIVSFGHMSILDLLSNGTISKDYFDNSFKFAFVRNPWDRAVSLYHYLRSRSVVKERSFSSFCYRYLKHNQITPVGLYNVRGGFSQCNKQISWLVDNNGKFFVDFIGRYEKLQKDFDKVCGLIGIPSKILPVEWFSRRSHYYFYYTKDTKEIVGDFYKEDIERFGYEFEKPNKFCFFPCLLLYNCIENARLQKIKDLIKGYFPLLYTKFVNLLHKSIKYSKKH
ncbi:MAG: sulfotransferase family protein [Omnitrophica bacterium]|nr:sulfotransferase family protein [Candidatus Omnitrophota bacterium]